MPKRSYLILIRIIFGIFQFTLIPGFIDGLFFANNVDRTIKIYFYYGFDIDEHCIYNLEKIQQIFNHHRYFPYKRTVIYIHGFQSNQSVSSTETVIRSYLDRGDHNVFSLDWSGMAGDNYFRASMIHTQSVGVRLAEVLSRVIRRDLLDHSLLHIVGFSLGGQIAGVVGRQIIRSSRRRYILPRITALDPAYVPFYVGIGVNAVNRGDAEFVDIIHTDSVIYGAPFSTGTADFWPNGATSRQPGCPERTYHLLNEDDMCSHRRSWQFWAESVSSKRTQKFLAVKAYSWEDFRRGTVTLPRDIAVMGFDCSTDVAGNYFLRTNPAEPFARGRRGIRPISQIFSLVNYFYK